MSSQSFYRKWRSQTFSDVVGQSHVTRTLRNALQNDRIGHAYLLCGPRGVGKTSVARILAKAINCQQRKDGEPCNACRMCVAVTEGRALDVIEVDAASNRRIEEMRELRDKVNFAPSEGNYKVYILDEAHMLTNEASNALLKTLEEPPAHTVFVLVTTEAHKIAETIRSRCQRFNFRRISTKESIERLSLVCEREGLTVSPEALALVARAATGSLRDAEGLLDQLVAYCGPGISLQQVQEVLGLAGETAVVELAEHVLSGDLARGLEVINGVADAGADLRRFAEDFLDYLRGVLLVKSGVAEATLADAGSDVVAGLRQAAQRVALDDLVALLRIFSDTATSRAAGSAQLPLELAVAEAVLHLRRVRQSPEQVERLPQTRRDMKPESRRPFALARPATIAAPQQVPAPPERLADSGTSEGIAGGDERPPQPRRDMKPESLRPAAAARAEAVAAPQQVPPLPEKRAVSDRAQVIAEGDGQGLAPSVASEAPKQLAVAEPEALGTYLEQLRRRWTEVIDGVGVVNKLLQAVVRSCGPYEAHAGALSIGCDSVFHKDKVGQGQNRRVLEKVVAEVLGVRVTLEFDVVPRHKRGQPPAPTSDPLVKEVLSWGGRIKAVVSDNPDGDSAVGDASDGGVIVATDRKTRSDEEVNGES